VTVWTPPLVVAALVLCVAGVAKLRSPGAAVAALSTLGIRVPRLLIRALAVLELALGAFVALDPVRVASAVVACLYALFAGLSLALASRRANCGCFGEQDAPASVLQSLLSGALALVAIAAAIWPPSHGIGWVLGHDLPLAAALFVGIAGAVYASVVAYTDLPPAWTAWSAR
jgi:uncharacterized membrane protein YphA (DoxX/SURF4 family)